MTMFDATMQLSKDEAQSVSLKLCASFIMLTVTLFGPREQKFQGAKVLPYETFAPG